MNAAAQMGGSDVGAEDHDPYDIHYLRETLKRVLRGEPPQFGDSVAHSAALRGEGSLKLSRPAGTYLVEQLVTTEDGVEEVREVHKRKPAHGQWTTIARASETRRSGSSGENITDRSFGTAKYMRALYGLSSGHIQVIQALYSPSAHMRRNSQRGLIQRLVSRYRVHAVKLRAKKIAMLILSGQGAAHDVRRAFNLSPENWRKSRNRIMRSEIAGDLAAMDAAALLAWGRACEQIFESS